MDANIDIPRFFIDTNIAQDIIQLRDGYATSMLIFKKAERGLIRLAMSPVSAITLSYLNRKVPHAIEKIKELLSEVEMVNVTADLLNEAYQLEHCPDLEGELQYLSAAQSGSVAIITRNLRDFRKGKIPAMTPDEALKSLLRTS